MPNLVKVFRVEVSFLYEGQKATPRATGTQNYPAEDRVKSVSITKEVRISETRHDQSNPIISKVQFMFNVPLILKVD